MKGKRPERRLKAFDATGLPEKKRSERRFDARTDLPEELRAYLEEKSRVDPSDSRAEYVEAAFYKQLLIPGNERGPQIPEAEWKNIIELLDAWSKAERDDSLGSLQWFKSELPGYLAAVCPERRAELVSHERLSAAIKTFEGSSLHRPTNAAALVMMDPSLQEQFMKENVLVSQNRTMLNDAQRSWVKPERIGEWILNTAIATPQLLDEFRESELIWERLEEGLQETTTRPEFKIKIAAGLAILGAPDVHLTEHGRLDLGYVEGLKKGEPLPARSTLG